MWYYGVKYAEGCRPSDLWTTYFTSSKYVHEYRKVFGEPDIIKIRKTFNTAYDAIVWEDKVIRKARLYSNPNFLNKSYSGSIYYDIEVRKKMADHAKQPRSQKFKNARSKTAKRLWEEGVYDNRPKPNDEYKAKMSASLKKRYSQIEHHSKGATLSIEHKNNISNSIKKSEKFKAAIENNLMSHSGESNGMYGKHHSDITKNKIKEKSKNRKKYQCVCGKLATPQILGRFHKQCGSTAELQQMLESMKNKDK